MQSIILKDAHGEDYLKILKKGVKKYIKHYVAAVDEALDEFYEKFAECCDDEDCCTTEKK